MTDEKTELIGKLKSAEIKAKRHDELVNEAKRKLEQLISSEP